MSVGVDPKHILKNAVFIDSIEGNQHVVWAYDDIKNLQLGLEDKISMSDEDDVTTNDELFPTDNQEPFIHFQLTAPGEGVGLSDLKKLRKLLYPSKQNLWENMTGGAIRHFFAKDLENNNPEIYASVMDKLQNYIDCVQQMYPLLTHVKGGAIMSAPNAPVQYQGHNERLHSDYTANVLL